MNMLLSALQNKHTSIAGVVYLALKTFVQLMVVWWPDQKDKLETTGSILEGAAVAYGLIAAGDASRGKQQLGELQDKVATAIQTGNTDMLKRDQSIKVASDLGKADGTIITPKP